MWLLMVNIMGAVYIRGSFESSDWRRTIQELQNSEKRYYKNANGDIVEDVDYNMYCGGLLTIYGWKYKCMNDSSEQDILNYIWNDNGCSTRFEKWEGLVVEGPVIGYDLYKPTFVELNSLSFSYKEYIDKRRGNYALLARCKDRHSREYIDVIRQGNLRECKEGAARKLCLNTEDVYVICGANGKHYRCFNTVKRVKTTNQVSKFGKLEINKVYKYYYGGCAAI